VNLEVQHLLTIKNLHVEYRTLEGVVKAVNGLDLTLDTGQTLGLVGETGAGKTSTALSIMNLVPNPPGVITSGEIWYNSKNLLNLTDKKLQLIRGNHISMIFQNPMASLNPSYSIGSQIMEVLQLHQNLNKKEARKKTAGMLRTVGILDTLLDRYPYEFSGGMQQRVSIAIALACKPHILIADEPTTALDVTIQAQVLELMKKLKKDFSSSLILITHDLGLVAEVCDDVAIMYAGTIVEKGSVEQIYKNPMHPYTIGLFNSIPVLDRKVEKLKPIDGLSPDPKNLPSGCRFHPRCPHKMDICKKEFPQMIDSNSGHEIACWRYGKRSVE